MRKAYVIKVGSHGRFEDGRHVHYERGDTIVCEAHEVAPGSLLFGRVELIEADPVQADSEPSIRHMVPTAEPVAAESRTHPHHRGRRKGRG